MTGFNTSAIDGVFRTTTRMELEEALTKARQRRVLESNPDTTYCRLTRTNRDAYEGLVQCKLEFVDPQTGAVEPLSVISGLPGAQNFLLWNDPLSVVGSGQPIPQGRYYIGDIDWADGKDNFNASHLNEGIGPVWVPLIKQQPDDRDAFGFHADWNWIQNGTSPGSAGCVCPTTSNDLEKLVQLLRKHDPRTLVVSWGL